MKNITVPTIEQVSKANQQLFSQLEKAVGFVPNMYAVLAHSPTALGDYLSLQNRKNSLSAKEREVINLVVSQYNGCKYCQAAHTEIGQMVGFSTTETLEIRQTTISFDPRLQALAQFTLAVVHQKGEVEEALQHQFFNAGFTTESLVDVIMTVGDKIITNYLFALAKVPIDFPLAENIQPSS